MKVFLFFIAFIMYCSFGFSQQDNRKGYFNVIISLSAINTDSKVNEIKTFASASSTGLIYEGYCKNQKCIILKASLLNFNSAADVVSLLKSKIGDDVLCSKNYTIQDFYKLCTFESEEEYHYFKITYH